MASIPFGHEAHHAVFANGYTNTVILVQWKCGEYRKPVLLGLYVFMKGVSENGSVAVFEMRWT